MKSCEEITRDVFAARDAYELRKKAQKKKIIRAAIPSGCTLLAAVCCVGIFVVLPRTFRTGSSAPAEYYADNADGDEYAAAKAAGENEILIADDKAETAEETLAGDAAEGLTEAAMAETAAESALILLSTEEAENYIASCSEETKSSLASYEGQKLLMFTDGLEYAVLTPDNSVIFLSGGFDITPLYAETDDPYAYYCSDGLTFEVGS